MLQKTRRLWGGEQNVAHFSEVFCSTCTRNGILIYDSQVVQARYWCWTTEKGLHKWTARSEPKAQHSHHFYVWMILDSRMSRYFTVLVSFGILPPLLLGAGAIKCSEKETLLKQIPGVVTLLTDCLMECTGMTYIKKLQLQDNRNIKMKDSTEGKEPVTFSKSAKSCIISWMCSILTTC